MSQPSKRKRRPAVVYVDEDRERFEARLHENATAEPRVPAMISTKGKRTKYTGLSTEGAVAAVKTATRKKTREKH